MAHLVRATPLFHSLARAANWVQHAVMDLDSWLSNLDGALVPDPRRACLLCGTGYAVFGVFAAPRLDAYRLLRLLL